MKFYRTWKKISMTNDVLSILAKIFISKLLISKNY